MPVITITTGALTKEKKKELMQRLTEVSVEITGAPIGFHTVLVNELPYDAMSVGNKTVEEIAAAMDKK